jgi:DNA-binding PadR family transcriptional regulator
MSLKYAILGLLTFEPMSGYTLKTKYFDQSIAYFWPADQAQIYRTLYRLEGDGWVESELETQETKPDRKHYQITPQGMAELRNWLTESRPPPAERFPLLVQLYFCRHLSKDELLALLRDQYQQHEARLAELRAIQLGPPDSEMMAKQLMFGGFTLDFGRRYEQMQLEWLAAVIAHVEKMD